MIQYREVEFIRNKDGHAMQNDSEKVVVGSNHGVNYLSLISAVSALAVVYMHTNNCYWTFSQDSYWFSANIIESLFYFAVPCFFMVSGATLIDYRNRYTTKTFFIKRIKKTAIPFIAWSTLAFIYLLLNGRIHLGEHSLRIFIDSILGAKYFGLYWFFPALFVIYLCMPLFSAVNKDLRKSVFSYLIALAFVCSALVPLLISALNIRVTWPFNIPVTGGFLIYPLIGYLIHNYEAEDWTAKAIYVAGFIGFLTICIGTYTRSLEAGEIVSIFKGYENAPCILYSTAVFLFFKRHHGALSKPGFSKVIDILAKYGYSVYLMHWFFVDCAISLFGAATFNLVFRIIAPLGCTAICIAIAWVIKKIPIIRAILP